MKANGTTVTALQNNTEATPTMLNQHIIQPQHQLANTQAIIMTHLQISSAA